MFETTLLSKPLFLWRKVARRLWVRTTLIAALSLVAAVLGSSLGAFVPQALVDSLETRSVARILEILASSMLAVTTFSLSVMVSARQWASQQSTPRAHRVVREDPITQIALATFLGAFVFALASLVLVEIGLYTGGSLVVILGFTIVVILLVVLAILRWIDHLSELGAVSATARRIEDRTRAALDRCIDLPCLGARPGKPEDAPDHADVVAAGTTGYIQHIDTGSLDELADEGDGEIWVEAMPGSFVAEGQPLLRATGSADHAALRNAFAIGDSRSFDQDPRFGLLVLSEIAQRALSPGVNDPGTAIDVIRRLLRLLVNAPTQPSDDSKASFSRVRVPPILPDDLLQDAFAAIARDAGGTVEVHLVLQSALARLAQSDDAEMTRAARRMAARALAFADDDLALDADRAAVRDRAPADL